MHEHVALPVVRGARAVGQKDWVLISNFSLYPTGNLLSGALCSASNSLLNYFQCAGPLAWPRPSAVTWNPAGLPAPSLPCFSAFTELRDVLKI